LDSNQGLTTVKLVSNVAEFGKENLLNILSQIMPFAVANGTVDLDPGLAGTCLNSQGAEVIVTSRTFNRLPYLQIVISRLSYCVCPDIERDSQKYQCPSDYWPLTMQKPLPYLMRSLAGFCPVKME